MITVINTEQYGRAVIAERAIKAGTIVERAEILVLSPEDTIKVNQTDLQYYTFTYDLDTKQDCLVMGVGEIFNHSDDANVSYELINLNGRKQMVYTAIKDIAIGEQLFIDYNADIQHSVDVLNKYSVNMY